MTGPYDYGEDAGKGFESYRPTARDIANVLLAPLDLDMQLVAIRNMLQRNRNDQETLRTEIQRLRKLQASDDYGEAFYQSVYEEGTHSLAAVGMLAPLVETLIVRLLGVARKLVDVRSLRPLHARWCASATDVQRWSCKYRWDKKTEQWEDDIIGGINQFIKALRIGRIFSPSDLLLIGALFHYRNNMLHNGMEWPVAVRKRFDSQRSQMPPAWFSTATTGDQPWIFYMTDCFSAECLELVERFVDCIGTMVLERADVSLSLDMLRS